MLKIKVDGNISRALKKLTEKVRNTKQKDKIVSKRYYKKKSQKKREELQKAEYKNKKENGRNK
jgi:small subunit ribosomal protein S21